MTSKLVKIGLIVGLLILALILAFLLSSTPEAPPAPGPSVIETPDNSTSLETTN